jgi:arylsulfatase A-like enzyme
VGELTTCQDLLPTLIELCGLKAPVGTRFDGVSLADLLRGSQPHLADRMVVVQYHIEIPKWNATVMWKKWRLVKGKELYDIAADPGESRDLARQHPDIVKRIERIMAEARIDSAEFPIRETPRRNTRPSTGVN